MSGLYTEDVAIKRALITSPGTKIFLSIENARKFKIDIPDHLKVLLPIFLQVINKICMDFAGIFNAHAGELKDWIWQTLKKFEGDKIPVSELNQPRLQDYFPLEYLQKSYVIYVDEIPVFPLASIGIEEFAEMNQHSFRGIAYLDCFFIRSDQERNTSLHFHELIHTIQWDQLGMERFLLCYGYGLITQGYRDSPLEVMAYDLEDRFKAGDIFDAVSLVNGGMKQFKLLADQLAKQINQ